MFKLPKFQWFQCTGNSFDKNFRNPDGYLTQNDVSHINQNEIYTFFGRTYNDSLWFSDLTILFSLARKGIMQLEHADISYETTNYEEIRRRICEFFLGIRSLLMKSKDEALKNMIIPHIKLILNNHVTRLKSMPDYVIFNSAHNASYNYLHLSLDMYWLFLTLEHNLEDEANRLDVFEKKLIELITDLCFVADKIFERSSVIDLTKLSPFVCSCFKELWLLIQLYVEKLHQQHFCKDFWMYYNQVNVCSNGKQAVKNIWLLYHVSRLQGYDPNGTFIGPNYCRVVSNYGLIEQSLRIICNNNLDEQLMCSCLYLIASFQTNWWKKDASFDLLQVLWEYFYKRINTSFTVDSTNISDYNILTDNLINHDLTNPSSSFSSYDVFLSLLAKYLTYNPLHWPKLKGRIYSKLPAQKLAVFHENGLHNIVQLFFVLSYSVNFFELTDKLQSLLSQLPETISENSSVYWNTYVSLLHVRKEKQIVFSSDTCAPILLAVQSACSDRSKSHLMRIFIDGLLRLLDGGLSQEYMLFDNWVHRYLQWCSYADACNLLDILMKIVENVRENGLGREWWPVLETHVVPTLKQFSAVSDSPIQVAELAATLVSADLQRFKTLLDHMTGDSIHIPQAIKFLTTLLDHKKSQLNELQEHQSILIQGWIRIALLSTDKTELTELTESMAHLPDWPQIIGSFDIHTEDPLFAVIRLAGYRIRDSSTVQDNFALKKWFETYFGRMDRWIAPVISTVERGDNILVLRIYTCASLLFYHCSSALYIKSKNTCLLYRLTTTLLLPSSVLMNKKPANIILTALRRTWHFFVRGIGRLDFKTDNYIERTLKDMVVRYVPHMYDPLSPIIRSVDVDFETGVSVFIFEKIAVTFLPCKSKTIHDHSTQALKLILEMTKICDSGKMKVFVETFLPYLFEMIIFVDDTSTKNNVLQIIQSIKMNQNYQELLVHNALITVINKHLSFYSTNVFKFIEFIIPLIPNEINDIIPNFKEMIIKVETMRGVGYDNTLRKGLLRIQTINQHSN